MTQEKLMSYQLFLLEKRLDDRGQLLVMSREGQKKRLVLKFEKLGLFECVDGFPGGWVYRRTTQKLEHVMID